MPIIGFRASSLFSSDSEDKQKIGSLNQEFLDISKITLEEKDGSNACKNLFELD